MLLYTHTLSCGRVHSVLVCVWFRRLWTHYLRQLQRRARAPVPATLQRWWDPWRVNCILERLRSLVCVDWVLSERRLRGGTGKSSCREERSVWRGARRRECGQSGSVPLLWRLDCRLLFVCFLRAFNFPQGRGSCSPTSSWRRMWRRHRKLNSHRRNWAFRIDEGVRKRDSILLPWRHFLHCSSCKLGCIYTKLCFDGSEHVTESNRRNSNNKIWKSFSVLVVILVSSCETKYSLVIEVREPDSYLRVCIDKHIRQ